MPAFETWLERNRLLLMDVDPDVVGISSQPFWQHWHDGASREHRHAPDFFVRHAEGSTIGLPPDVAEKTTPRPEFDPQRHSPAQRERVKAAELTAAGHQVPASGIKQRRRHYQRDGRSGRRTQPTRRRTQADADTRWSPFHPYYHC